MAEPYQRKFHYICVSKSKPLTQVLLILRNRPVHYIFDLSGILSEAALTNERVEKRNLFCTKNAFRRVGVQFISAHALEYGSQMTDVIVNI